MTDPLDVAQWLTRFEKHFGVNETRQSMQKLSEARTLFFDELGYNITRKQYEYLRGDLNERIQIESQQTKTPYKRKTPSKKGLYQIVYKDTKTGRFTTPPKY